MMPLTILIGTNVVLQSSFYFTHEWATRHCPGLFHNTIVKYSRADWSKKLMSKSGWGCGQDWGPTFQVAPWLGADPGKMRSPCQILGWKVVYVRRPRRTYIHTHIHSPLYIRYFERNVHGLLSFLAWNRQQFWFLHSNESLMYNDTK
jgi:hypothetical protein